VALTPADFFVEARFEPVALGLLVAAAAWYFLSVRRLTAAGRSWPTARSASFAAAWMLVAISVFSGLSRFTPTNFTAYGALFIMVGMAAPALLALSAPLRLALLLHPERAALLDRLPARIIAFPLVTWILFAVSIFVLFLTGLFNDTLTSSTDQQLVFLGLLVVGYLHYWPVVDADPIPRRIAYWPRVLYLLLIFPVYAILGMTLESQETRLAPGISLGSLHLGAAIIWVAGETVALTGAIWIFAQWLRNDQRRAQAHDAGNQEAAERQLALWRASRDAAARAAGPAPQ
jgi:cytochrome c oxidase assembly factor CtaG